MKYIMMTVFVLLCTRIQAQMGIAASPMQLSFDAQPGSTQTLPLTLNNPSGNQITVTATLADWYRDSTGSIVYTKTTAALNSCTDWLKIFPGTEFVLKPGESKPVTVMITVPPNAAQRCTNSMLLFTQLDKQPIPQKNGVVINLAVRVGIQIYHVPPGLNRKEIDIVQFTDTLFQENNIVSKQLFLRLKNSGQLSTEGKASIELTHLGTGHKTSLPAISFFTLPGAVRQIKVPLTGSLPPGRYSAVALVDYGEDQELRIGELEFTQAATTTQKDR